MDRRELLKGLLAVGIASPAIVSLANIMPVRNRLIRDPGLIRYVDGRLLSDVPDWSPLYFEDEWSNRKLVQFSKEINREYVRENLFSPYYIRRI